MRRGVVIALIASGCGRAGFELRDGAVRDVAGDTSADDMLATDAQASLCPGSSALICDGWEQGYGSWSTSTGGGTIGFDTTRTFRGGQSLHLTVGPITTLTDNPRASLNSTQGLVAGTATGTVYARGWFYFASPYPTTEFAQVINLVEDASGLGISVGTRNGMLVNNDYTDGVYKQSATTALPLDRWTCVVFAVPSGQLGTARVYVDGAEVTDIAITKAAAQPVITIAYVGMTWVGMLTSLPAAEEWLDEVIVDTSPVTCAQ